MYTVYYTIITKKANLFRKAQTKTEARKFACLAEAKEFARFTNAYLMTNVFGLPMSVAE